MLVFTYAPGMFITIPLPSHMNKFGQFLKWWRKLEILEHAFKKFTKKQTKGKYAYKSIFVSTAHNNYRTLAKYSLHL